MADFEIYRRHIKGRPITGATVTITRRGKLAFSVPALEALGNPQHLVLLIDRKERLIGFRAPAPADLGSTVYRVRASRMISGAAVCTELGLDLSEARRYPLDSVAGVLCIDLKEPGEIVTVRHEDA